MLCFLFVENRPHIPRPRDEHSKIPHQRWPLKEEWHGVFCEIFPCTAKLARQRSACYLPTLESMSLEQFLDE